MNIEFSKDEVPILIYALGRCYTVPEAWPIAQRLIALVGSESVRLPIAQPRPVATEPAPAASAPPVPEVLEFLAAHPDSIVKNGGRLVVKWKDGKTSSVVQASCWDEALFPAVLRTVKTDAVFQVKRVRTGNATYLNIVGVK